MYFAAQYVSNRTHTQAKIQLAHVLCFLFLFFLLSCYLNNVSFSFGVYTPTLIQICDSHESQNTLLKMIGGKNIRRSHQFHKSLETTEINSREIIRVTLKSHISIQVFIFMCSLCGWSCMIFNSICDDNALHKCIRLEVLFLHFPVYCNVKNDLAFGCNIMERIETHND